MKVIQNFPPNIDAIRRILHPAKNYIFTYGHELYSPTTTDIPQDVMVHEMVHEKQQTGFFHTPKRWWKKYLNEPKFRYRQELEAYRAQWKFVHAHLHDRELARRMLNQMAKDLSSSNYGNLVGFSDALEQIRNG